MFSICLLFHVFGHVLGSFEVGLAKFDCLLKIVLMLIRGVRFRFNRVGFRGKFVVWKCLAVLC